MAKAYVDSRGWRYKVQGGIGDNAFKARYFKPGKQSGKCCHTLPWRETEEQAQADLDAYAESKGWKVLPDAG